MHQLTPLGLQSEFFYNANPMMAPVAAIAEQARKSRKAVATDNPFVAMQENASRQIVAALDTWRQASETFAERCFFMVLGEPRLEAAEGMDRVGTRPLRKAGKSPLHRELLQKRIAELKSRIALGGLREAIIRALLYVGTGRAAVDERGFEALRRIRRAHGDIPLSAFKALVREQFYLLLIDTEAALAALPSMLPADADTRRKAYELIKQVMIACGPLSDEDNKRMQRVAGAFGLDEAAITVPNLTVISSPPHEQPKPSSPPAPP